MQKFLDSDQFGVAMFDIDADYAGISRFYGSDRRTGHRWQKDGPSNQVARFIQLLMALGLTLDDAKVLISAGQAASGTALPKRVVELATQLATIRQGLRAKQRAARGGAKGASNGRRESRSRAPKKAASANVRA